MKKKGFTLIELLVVIAIIIILAAIIAFSASRAIERARVNRCIRDLKSIQSAALNYYTDTGRFPPSDDIYCSVGVDIRGIDFLQNQAGVAGWDGPYLEKWPVLPWSNPWPRAPGFYRWIGAWPNFAGDNRVGEVVELNFGVAQNWKFLTTKGPKIDREIDDGNLNTGNFRLSVRCWRPCGSKVTYTYQELYYAVAFH